MADVKLPPGFTLDHDYSGEPSPPAQSSVHLPAGFTLDAGAAPPAARSSSDASTWYQRAAHGFGAPVVGMDMLASQVEQHLPFIPKETAAHDLALAEQEQREFQKQGSAGFSGWEMIGNLANPLNYLVGGPARGVGLAATIGRGMASGASAAAVQPSSTDGYWLNKAAGVAGGAALGGAVSAAAEPIAKAIAGNSPAALDKFIKDNFTRAIKPSISGKGTASQLAAYDNKVASAINSIVDNKANLRLLDEHGQPASGTPKTLDQFAQAIDQTKQEIFKRYDAMAKAATSAPGVDLAPISSELRKVGTSTVVRDLDPAISEYATRLADTLQKRGRYSTEEAQQAVQHLNSSLQAFYKNPNHETASRAGVDALIANKLRSGLDQTIEQAVGPGYQELKNQYGALRTLEKDVVHRAIVTGRQEAGRGLMGRIGDVVSAEEVIRGLLRLDPTSMATGAGIRAFTGFVRHLHNPNRAVSRIFDAAEKRLQGPPSAARGVASQAVRAFAPPASVVGVDNLMGYMPP